jgi:CheY-like chemotaxis protein
VRVTNKPILLVEDDQVDMMTVIRALKQVHVTNKVVHLENGEDALNYLRDEDNEKPCIILLDLNMPIMNGIEFLQAAKDDEELMRIPIVVLTTSVEQQDKLSSFNAHRGEGSGPTWSGESRPGDPVIPYEAAPLIGFSSCLVLLEGSA